MNLIDFSLKNQKIVKFKFLKDALGGIKDKKILDIGCGKGEFILTLKKFFPENQYFGCDISSPDVSVLNEIGFKELNLDNKESLSYPDQSFDIVMMVDLLEHVERPADVLKEVRRILKKGGKFFLHVPTERELFTVYRIYSNFSKTECKRDYGDHIQNFTRREVLKMLGDSGFNVVSAHYNYHFFGGLRDTLKFILAARQFKRNKLENFPRGKNDINLIVGNLGKKLFSLLDFLSYYESLILAKVPFSAMAMNILAE